MEFGIGYWVLGEFHSFTAVNAQREHLLILCYIGFYI